MIELLPRLRRFARALARDPADADGLVQLTLERALRRADQFQPGLRLDSWMFGIMKHAWIDEQRAGQRRASWPRRWTGGWPGKRALSASPSPSPRGVAGGCDHQVAAADQRGHGGDDGGVRRPHQQRGGGEAMRTGRQPSGNGFWTMRTPLRLG
jgi:DNA-directed RNA polymerase specialized sigma24 family protein